MPPTRSPQMFTSNAIDEALRDIMGEVKGAFRQLRRTGETARIDEARFQGLSPGKPCIFLGEGHASDADISDAFRHLAGMDLKL